MDEQRGWYSQVVGTAGATEWSQVGVRMQRGGWVAVVIELAGGEELGILDLPQVGGEMLTELSELPLATGLEELTKKVQAIVQGAGEIDTKVMVAIKQDDKLRIVGKGARAYLLRAGKVGLIKGAQQEKCVGQVKEEDQLVLATEKTVEVLGEDKWRRVMQKGLAGTEELAVLIHGQEVSAGMAVVTLQIRKEETVVPVASPPPIKLPRWRNALGRWREIFVRPLQLAPEKQKLNTWVGAMLLVMLVVGIGVGIVRRTQIVKERAWKSLTESVEQKIAEAASVGDLNTERAGYLLTQARNEIENYRESLKENERGERVDELAGKLARAEAEIFRREEVEISTLLEWNLIAKNFVPGAVVPDEEGNLIVANKESGTIVGVSLADRSSWVVREGGARYIDLAFYDKEVYGLREDGVYEIPRKRIEGNSGEEKKVIEPDEFWQGPRYIDVYGGNVYVLDRGTTEIWKYPVLSEGFGARRRWLSPGIELDLSNAAEMFIDGDVWLVTSTGKLEKYSRGVPVTLSMEGFPYAERERLVNPTGIYAGEEIVYVLEAGVGRVVAVESSSGKFVKQYVNEGLKDGQAVVADEERVYVVTPEKLLWFAR